MLAIHLRLIGGLMTKRVLLTFLLLALVAPSLVGSTIIVRRAAGAPAGTHFLDDFSSDTSANWPQYGSWTLTITGGEMDASSATGSAIYTTPMDTASGYICFKITGVDGYQGMKFRASSDDSTSSYILRCNAGSGVAWRMCDVASCSDIATASAGCPEPGFPAALLGSVSVSRRRRRSYLQPPASST